MSIRVSSALLAATVLAAGVASAQTDVRLDEVMSAQDQVQTGVANLSAAQRAQLERWLARYTGTVAAVARRLDNTPVREQRIEAAPRAAPRQAAPATVEQPRITGRPWLPQRLPNGAQMLESIDGSTFVMLADGTMWEVYLPHRPNAGMWRTGDLILVKQASAPVGEFDHQLINGAARSTVSARFAGWVEMKDSPADEAPRQ